MSQLKYLRYLTCQDKKFNFLKFIDFNLISFKNRSLIKCKNPSKNCDVDVIDKTP